MADARKLILKILLSLPSPVLRAMSGGGVVYRGGRTLDPRFQYLAHASANLPPVTGLAPEDVRAGSAAGLALMAGAVEPGVGIEAVSIEAPQGPIRARLYRPDDQDPAAPLMVFAHFGGGVIGDLETCHAFCSILARTVRGESAS